MSINIINLLKEKKITKSEYLFLEVLYYYAQKFTKSALASFYRWDTDFTKKGILTLPTLRKVRKSLKEKRIIDFSTLRNDKNNICYRILVAV